MKNQHGYGGVDGLAHQILILAALMKKLNMGFEVRIVTSTIQGMELVAYSNQQGISIQYVPELLYIGGSKMLQLAYEEFLNVICHQQLVLALLCMSQVHPKIYQTYLM